MVKRSLGFVLIILCSTGIFAQRFNFVVFNKLPQDFQLYPRDDKNESKIPISGIFEQNGFDYLSVKVFRNGKIDSYTKSSINYISANRGFFSTEVRIKSELAEYDLEFYSIRGKDSSLVVKRKNIVSGDVYLVSGQSNSYAWGGTGQDQLYRGEFARSFGFVSDYVNYVDYNPKDTLWSIANENAKVGHWAGEIQRLIIENEKIPVCIINGGSGGSSMEYNLFRTENKADYTTSSGRLYYRAKKAGVTNNIKAFIYRQGENEANDNIGALAWLTNFRLHMKKLTDEYPGLKQFYLPQINVQEGSAYQGLVREYQRLVINENNLVNGFATVGTPDTDGVHYGGSGYRQSGNELYRIMKMDLYNGEKKLDFKSPNIVRAYYANEDKVNVVLEFDQNILLPNDTLFMDKSGQKYIRKLQENFSFSPIKYAHQNEWIIQNIRVQDNKLIFQLFEPPVEDVVSYIPTSWNTTLNNPFPGPFIKNKSGMRAFAFQNIKIESPKNSINSLTYKNKIIIEPQSYQLFPRNVETNLGKVKISGVESSGDFSYISLNIFRGNSRVLYIPKKLNYINDKASWDFEFNILAEKVNYKLNIYIVNSKYDSTLIISKTNLVAGDVYILNGNNTASSSYSETSTDDFCRTFGINTLNGNEYSYNTKDTLWSVSNSLGYLNNVGSLGYIFQKRLSDELNIPIALINLSDHFSTSSQFSSKTSQLLTNFDKLIFKSQKAEVIDNIRGFIMLNGETDVLSNTKISVFEKGMDSYIDLLKLNFPKIEKYYFGQMHTYRFPNESSSAIREVQRKLGFRHEKVFTFTTMCIKGFNGLTYSNDGNIEFGNSLSDIILGKSPTTFPNLKKVFQSQFENKGITLVFNEGQKLLYTNLEGLNNSLFIDNFSNQIAIAKANLNYFNFELKVPKKVEEISYEGQTLFDSTSPFFLKAFPFYKVKVQKMIEPLNLSLKSKSFNNVELVWNKSSLSSSYRVERKIGTKDSFEPINSTKSNSFNDLSPPLGQELTYRVFAENDSTESEKSNYIQFSLPDSLPSIAVSVKSISLNSISLSWPDALNAKEYYLERRINSQPFDKLIQTSGLTYLDDNLKSNTNYEYRLFYTTEGGISKKSFVSAKTTMVLGSISEVTPLVIFPNPLKNFLFIKWIKVFSGTIQMISVNGSILEEWNMANCLNTELDIRKYNPGTYIIKVFDSNANFNSINKILIFN